VPDVHTGPPLRSPGIWQTLSRSGDGLVQLGSTGEEDVDCTVQLTGLGENCLVGTLSGSHLVRERIPLS